jgi:hypothetical protein
VRFTITWQRGLGETHADYLHRLETMLDAARRQDAPAEMRERLAADIDTERETVLAQAD